jgi:hypothetical protein
MLRMLSLSDRGGLYLYAKTKRPHNAEQTPNLCNAAIARGQRTV